MGGVRVCVQYMFGLITCTLLIAFKELDLCVRCRSCSMKCVVAETAL